MPATLEKPRIQCRHRDHEGRQCPLDALEKQEYCFSTCPGREGAAAQARRSWRQEAARPGECAGSFVFTGLTVNNKERHRRTARK